VPGRPHHIRGRGINKSATFNDHQDRARFLERLGENVSATPGSVYAWVLMKNHVHVRFKSSNEGISTVMRRLLTWYTCDFNRRHKRTEHLFENRYKSVSCEEETYLLALVRTKILQSLEEQARIMHETPSRDRGDGRATGQPQGLGPAA
jgi:REP element-mobilizing transposase RayT